MRVLIVEDSEDDELLLKRELVRYGFELESTRVQTAGEMRRELKERKWDVIVSDYRMPDFSALEALKVLKESGEDLPFIIVSGSIGEEMAVDALRAGADDFMRKENLARLGPAIEREMRETESRKERMKAQADLLASEERYRRLAANAPDVIFRMQLHPKLSMDFINAAAASMLGYEPQEFHADPDLLIKLMATEDRPLFQMFLESGGELKGPFSMRMAHKNGKQVWGEARFVPILDEAGKLVAVEGIMRDITERRRDIDKLEERRKEAEMASIRAQTYLDFLTHDITNILTPVMSYAQLLSENKDMEPNIRNYSSRIVSQIERAAEFVSNVKKLSRVERLDVESFEPIDLREALPPAEDALRKDHAGKSVKVTYDLPKQGPMWVLGKGYVEDILAEVLDNAAKHAHGTEAEIEVSVQPMTMGERDRYWVLRVADHGPGISDDMKKAIMTEVFDLSKASTRGVVSALSFMLLMTEQLGGQLWVGDRVPGQPDKGAKVVIMLPKSDGSKAKK